MLNNKEIGIRIKQARKNKNLTLDEVAEKINLNKSTLSRYEKGQINRIKLPIIQALANILDVSPSFLIGIETNLLEQNNDIKKRIHKELDSMNDEQLNKVELFIKEFIFNK